MLFAYLKARNGTKTVLLKIALLFQREHYLDYVCERLDINIKPLGHEMGTHTNAILIRALNILKLHVLKT